MKTLTKLLEAVKQVQKKAFLVTGAFNPYTRGHEEVARSAALHASANGYTHFYHGLGSSENITSAPLSFKQKEKIVKGSHKHINANMPKEHKGKLSYGIVPQKNSITPFQQITHLIEREGHTHITIGLGPDQIKSDSGKPALKQHIEDHIKKFNGFLGSDKKTVHKVKIDFHSLAETRNEDKLSTQEQRKLIKKHGRSVNGIPVMPTTHVKASHLRNAVTEGDSSVAHAHMPDSVLEAGGHKAYEATIRDQQSNVVPANEEKVRLATNAKAKANRAAKKAAKPAKPMPKKKKPLLNSYDPVLEEILNIFLTEKESKETRRKRDRRMYGHNKSPNELTPKQRLNRKKKSKRTVARRKANREGRTKKGDSSVELDHKNGNALDNGNGNLRVVSRHHNRSRNNNKNH